MDWQPIETAPKDGTPILGYVPGKPRGVQYVCWFGQQNDLWTFYAGRDEQCGVYPSHWMPLPASPAPPAHREYVGSKA